MTSVFERAPPWPHFKQFSPRTLAQKGAIQLGSWGFCCPSGIHRLKRDLKTSKPPKFPIQVLKMWRWLVVTQLESQEDLGRKPSWTRPCPGLLGQTSSDTAWERNRWWRNIRFRIHIYQGTYHKIGIADNLSKTRFRNLSETYSKYEPIVSKTYILKKSIRPNWQGIDHKCRTSLSPTDLNID